jgi:hypothetical protein
MAKWKLPEGRKPLTNDDMAALTHRLADTAIEQSELYQAAKRDAEEAEAYAAELEAKLAKAVEMLEREIRRVQKIQRDLPPPHTVGLIYVEAEYELMLAELKGQDDE